MASADLRDELTCSICTDIYTDPVTLICGHNYCQICITRTWDNQEEGEYSCPECRKRYRVRPELKRNLRLRNIAERFQETHKKREEVRIPCTYCIGYPVPAAKTCLHCEASLCEDHLRVHSKSEEHVLTEPTTSPENRKCSVHKKILEYYCCDDATCICVSCRLAGEHRGHQVETLNEASEKKKEKLRNIQQKLTSQREEAEKSVQSLEEHRRKVQNKTTRVIERVTALIRDIRKHLKVLKKRVLSEISSEEEQVSLRVSDLIRQLEIKKEELSRNMGDIEELCDMTDPVTVLKGRESDRDDYCDTGDTERCEIKVHDAGDLDVGLISVTLHSGLAGIVTRITRRCRVPEASDMLLDVNTASDMLLDVNTASDMLLDVNTASDMLLDVNTASDMLLDVNTASDMLLDVNTASDMLLDVNTASDTLLDVNTASDTLLDVNTASDMLLDVNTASDTLLDVNTASDTLLDVNTASDMLLDVNTASDMLLDVNTASDMLLDVNTASDMLLDVNTASDMLLDVNTASDKLLDVNTASDKLLDVNTASDMLLDVNTASDMLLDVNTASDMLLDVNTASDKLLDVNTASDKLLDVNTASDKLLDVNTASDMLLDVNTASDKLLDVNTASDMLLDVNTASDRLRNVKTTSNRLRKGPTIDMDEIPYCPLVSPISMIVEMPALDTTLPDTGHIGIPIRRNKARKTLISIVRELRPLWDMLNKKYHARDVQRKLWQQVADEMGVKVEEVQKRWRNLCDDFRREYKKILATKSGDGANPDASTSWASYDQMLFIVDTVEPRQLEGNVSPVHSVTPNAEEENCSETQEEFQTEVSLSSLPHTTNTQDLSELRTSRQLLHRPLKRRRIEKGTEDNLLQKEKKKMKILSESVQMRGNSNFHFLVSMVPLLDRIPMERQNSVRRKLLKLVSDEEEDSRCPKSTQKTQICSTLEPIHHTPSAVAPLQPTPPVSEPFFNPGLRECYCSSDSASTPDDTNMP